MFGSVVAQGQRGIRQACAMIDTVNKDEGAVASLDKLGDQRRLL